MSETKAEITEIEGLYTTDIEERNQTYWDNKEEVENLKQKDRERRQKTRLLIQNGNLSSGLDYHHASLIFQHGETTEDYKLAHALAEKAVNLGDDTAKWLYAATFDRWLISEGKPQKFGTQFKQNENGEWELGLPIDPKITVEERARWNVPPLAEALGRYKEKYGIK